MIDTSSILLPRMGESLLWLEEFGGARSTSRVSHIGTTVSETLDRVLCDGPGARSITVDHGTVFQSRALEYWAYRRGIQLDFIRPGKPVEKAFIESFNGRLRDECLDVH